MDASTITLESDQLGINVVDVWSTFIEPTSGQLDEVRFRTAFPKLFSTLTLQAENAIHISDSKLTTNAGVNARDLSNLAPDIINGFGGSINLLVPRQFPTQISLSNSTLEARSYAMGGNVMIDPYYYIVNRSDVITSAEFIGGDYIINAEFLLQSLDSIIDLSGQQSGDFVSSAVDVDLGAELTKLEADFLNLNSFVQASCDLYYAKKRSSFLIQPAKIKPSGFDDYLPSAPPSYLKSGGFVPTVVDKDVKRRQRLLSLKEDCNECI